jgi:hypothetical protein
MTLRSSIRIRLRARIVSVSIAACAAGLFATSCLAQEWSTLASAEDGFSVEFPGTAQPVKIDLDPAAMISARQWALDGGKVGYIVIAVQFKKVVAVDGFLDTVVKGAVGKCQLRDDRRTSFPGAISSDLLLDNCPDGNIVKDRINVYGPWLYQAIYAGPPGSENSADAQRFLNSFKITQSAPAVVAAPPAPPAAAAPEAPSQASAPAQPASAAWTMVTSEEDGFSAELPGSVQRENGTLDSSDQISDRRWSVFREQSGWMVVAVRYSHKVNDEALLSKIVGNMKGACEVRDERRLSYPGGFSSDFTLDKCPDGKMMRARVYLHNDVLYQVLALGPASLENTGDTKRFFDSFKLLPASVPAQQPASRSPAPLRTGPWGAIAIDMAEPDDDPSYGIGGGTTEKEAIANAMKFCKDEDGASCKVMVTYNACGAVAVSGKGSVGWGKAETKKTAEAQAVAGCKNDRCKVVVSDCN